MSNKLKPLIDELLKDQNLNPEVEAKLRKIIKDHDLNKEEIKDWVRQNFDDIFLTAEERDRLLGEE